MTRLLKPPARHLTIDEPVTLTDRYGEDRTFRVRVWQGVKATSVVLASNYADPETGLPGPSPSLTTVKLANLVLGSILGHPCCGMIDFEYYGQAHRLKMFRPTRRTFEWVRLEHILEGAVER